MDGVNTAFTEIFTLFKNGDFNGTIRKIEESEQKLIPENTAEFNSLKENLLIAKGSIYLAMENSEKAEEAFVQALSVNPKSADACAGLGQVLFARGQEKESLEMFKWALKYNPNHPASLKALGELNASGYEAAEPAGKRDSGSYIVEAYELFQRKMFTEALEKITMAEVIISENETEKKDFEKRGSIANFKGYNLLGLNQLKSARMAFETALHYNPNSSQACAGLGEVFFLNGMEKEGKVMYEWAIENNPANTAAIEGLAKCNGALGLKPDHNTLHTAKQDYNSMDFFKILGEAYEYFNKKDFLKSLVQIELAENVFKEQNLERSESYGIGSLFNFKGFNYLGLNELDQARECFEKSLNFNPKSSQACAGLGEIFYLSGQFEASKTMFEWGVKNNPANAFAVQGWEKSRKALNQTR